MAQGILGLVAFVLCLPEAARHSGIYRQSTLGWADVLGPANVFLATAGLQQSLRYVRAMRCRSFTGRCQPSLKYRPGIPNHAKELVQKRCTSKMFEAASLPRQVCLPHGLKVCGQELSAMSKLNVDNLKKGIARPSGPEDTRTPQRIFHQI